MLAYPDTWSTAMVELLKDILKSQYEASLAMLNGCIAACGEEHWEGKIANDTFRQIAYHTLFWTDMYLTRREEDFVLRELHSRGGDERGEALSPGLAREETLEYVQICRGKIAEVMGAEMQETLRGPSGFSWRKCTRAEIHIYNIRHIQHHTGAMAAYLRRVDPRLGKSDSLRWVGHGWR
jgi:hypothetical protein